MRVNIPTNLEERLEPLIEDMGYNSYAEFARESMRLRADELEHETDLEID